MRAAQATWVRSSGAAGAKWRGWADDLLVVAVVCVIFGLQIIAVMQTAGGAHAYATIASEGMQAE